MEQMTPNDFAMIIGLTLFVLGLSLLYDMRQGLARWWEGVNKSKSRYVQSGDPEPQPASKPESANAPGCATNEDERNGIAIGRNDRNDDLTRNERLRVQAEAIAALMATDSLYIPDGRGGHKKLGKVALIKLVTGLSANGRADSEYGMLRSELERLTHPTMTVTDGSEARTIAK